MSLVVGWVKSIFGCRTRGEAQEGESSSSALSRSRSTPVKVLCLSTLRQHDHNGAFSADGLFSAFQTQLGLKVDLRYCQTYPEAISPAGERAYHVVHERRHGTHRSGRLSPLPGGEVSTAPEDLEMVRQLARLVKPGGIYLIEGCHAGSGKGNFLKHLVSQCAPGVRVIGPKASQLFLDAPFSHDEYMYNYIRFYERNTGYGITRYYQHTLSGKVQNIPEEELFFLWEWLCQKEMDSELSERAFDLCLNLLAERNQPEGFAQVVSENQQLIEYLIGDPQRVAKDFQEGRSWINGNRGMRKEDTKRIWQSMLNDLRSIFQEIVYDPQGNDTHGYLPEESLCAPYQGWLDIYIPPRDIEHLPSENPSGLIWNIQNPRHPYAKAYSFLLGCGLIDRFKVLFMLLDNRQAGCNPATLAISAASDLAIHGRGEGHESVQVILAHDLQLIKESYRIAKEQGALKSWFVEISKGKCFDQYIDGMREFHYRHLSADPDVQFEYALNHRDVKWLEHLLRKRLVQTDLAVDRLSILDVAIRIPNGIAILHTLASAGVVMIPPHWIERQISNCLNDGNLEQALNLIDLFYTKHSDREQFEFEEVEKILLKKIESEILKQSANGSFKQCYSYLSRIPLNNAQQEFVKSLALRLLDQGNHIEAMIIAAHGDSCLQTQISRLSAEPALQLKYALEDLNLKWVELLLRQRLSERELEGKRLSIFDLASQFSDGCAILQTLLSGQVLKLPSEWTGKQIGLSFKRGDLDQAIDFIDLFFSHKQQARDKFEYQEVEKRLLNDLGLEIHNLIRRGLIEEGMRCLSKIPESYSKNRIVQSLAYGQLDQRNYVIAIRIAEHGGVGLMNQISNLLFNQQQYAFAIEAAMKNREAWKKEAQCLELYSHLIAYPINDYRHARLAALGLSADKDSYRNQAKALLDLCRLQLDERWSSKLSPLDAAREALITAKLIPEHFPDQREAAFERIWAFSAERQLSTDLL